MRGVIFGTILVPTHTDIAPLPVPTVSFRTKNSCKTNTPRKYKAQPAIEVQYREQERFDVRPLWVLLDESLYLLKWDFTMNPLLSHLTEPIIGHVSGNLT